MKVNGIQGKFIEYKGKPLVREGNEIHYGFMSDKYRLFMLVMSEKKASRLDVQIPDMVLVQIIANDESHEIKNQKMVSGLYEAFDLGTAWLERYNRA